MVFCWAPSDRVLLIPFPLSLGTSLAFRESLLVLIIHRLPPPLTQSWAGTCNTCIRSKFRLDSQHRYAERGSHFVRN